MHVLLLWHVDAVHIFKLALESWHVVEQRGDRGSHTPHPQCWLHLNTCGSQPIPQMSGHAVYSQTEKP